MPQQQILPTWTAWNNANFTSSTGMTDPRTGQPYAAGGLNMGDYFDATEKEANDASYTTTGTLHSGRYRLVLVDSGATAANVKTGTIGYLRAGLSVSKAAITAAGSGQTAGSYAISATGGGGSGAIVTVVVNSSGVIASATVTNPGYGYTSVPTLTLTALGGSTGTVVCQLTTSPNIVTSYDQAVGYVRPVVFLNSITPGNYGFIQELGVAKVLGKASSFTGAAAVGAAVTSTTSGLVDVPTAATTMYATTVGVAIDLPIVSNLFKVYLTGPVVQD